MRIKTIPELIERLEAIHIDLDPKHLTMGEYAEVGWARRSVQVILERCREHMDEQEADPNRPRLQLRPLAKCGVR